MQRDLSDQSSLNAQREGLGEMNASLSQNLAALGLMKNDLLQASKNSADLVSFLLHARGWNTFVFRSPDPSSYREHVANAVEFDGLQVVISSEAE